MGELEQNWKQEQKQIVKLLVRVEEWTGSDGMLMWRAG